MPNNVQNRLQISGDKEEVKKVFAQICSEDEKGNEIQIDFDKIKPMPAQAESDWKVKNWGTRRNAFAQNDKRNKDNLIYFQTELVSPIYLILLLSKKFPTVTFQLDYADEEAGCNTGKITIQNGNLMELDQPDSHSKEGYDMYFEFNPGMKKDYKLVDDNYELIKK